MERPYKQSDPRATFREVFFTAMDAAAVTTPLQSSDMGAFVVYIIKNAVAPALIGSPTITQLDAANAKGWFRLDLTAGNIDTPGNLGLVIGSTGGTKTMLRRDLWLSVDPAYFFTAGATLGTTSTVLTDRAEVVADYWKDALVLAHTGNLTGQVKKVGAYSASKLLTLASINSVQQVWTQAPANGDIFELINR